MSAYSAHVEAEQQLAVEAMLLSSHPDDHVSLRGIFASSNWKLHSAVNRDEALSLLRRNRIPVVICEYRLPDANWEEVWGETAKLPTPPNLIVFSRHADDRVRAEVLNLGDYEVLATPFMADEVFWLVTHAWLTWKRQWEVPDSEANGH